MITPRVSVLMSVYNGKEYLAEAVESVLAQTFADFEFLIVDDGSTDGASDLLREFAQRDPRVRLISQANQGLTRSLNNGLAAARGEYVARMDADDVCHPDRFARQVAFLDGCPEFVLVGGACRLIDARGVGDQINTMLTDPDAIDTAHLSGVTSHAHPTIMVRRKALQGVSGYDERYQTSQDLDLYLRLGESGRLTNLPEVVLDYRLHDGNVSVQKADQQDRDVTAMLREARRKRGLPATRGLPKTRWQYRRVLSRKYAKPGSRRLAWRLAWGAWRARPWSPRSVYSLLLVVVSLVRR